MVTKTHKADLGLGLPEKKKKKKKMIIKEPETQYSVLNNDNYFSDQSPTRANSHFNMGQGPFPEMCMGKKKKKKKGHSFIGELPQLPEPKLCARRAKSYSPGKQAHDQLEYVCLEKKKKRKSLPMIASHGSWLKTSPDRRRSEEVTKGGKKLKKHKKEKRARDPSTFSIQDRWLYEAGDALHACSVGKGTEEQMASGQKRKQGNPREHSVKVKKKKKKVHLERDTHLGQPRGSKSVESNPRKGSKKKPVKMEALEFIPIGDGPKTPVKKKMKAKKKVEQPVEELALKRKKKKRKECGEVKDPWEEVRRKALQEEIDRESGKTEAADSKSWTGTQFGQWDTAGFESEEQKLKFLKLMGGFKHLSPSASRSTSTVGKPNMALSKKEADSLQQNLQQDYDRAMSWKCSRGAGLGFTAAPDKVFYIDKNASRSVKLSD
ncbi:lysine-rich nucleolar protein 1 isoform X2 [Perognathus longimembris pacificus]|uniref:lysine-rich nucleolar protein 1 isoform X2 n=1 Tax=Perognathus longimembris pacificus TaxID=214514 RepID=UPI0020185B4B|nr:lysine-rich nucleolar protein 1 isoform X2 [Perognathus longimembris pacificus]